MEEFARSTEIPIRFIEFMPLDADGKWNAAGVLAGQRILELFAEHVRPLVPLGQPDASPARDYQFDDGKGCIGIIASVTEPFCGTCNRLRITPKGLVKTCLYGKEVMDLRNLLRFGASDDDIAQALMLAVQQKPKNGFEAEADREADIHASMATIGG